MQSERLQPDFGCRLALVHCTILSHTKVEWCGCANAATRGRAQRPSAMQCPRSGTLKLVIFDCDGTLVDSQHSIVAAMQGAFDAVSLACPPREVCLSIVGLSLPQAMARLLPEAEPAFHDEMSEHYKRAFHAMRAGGQLREPLYPGMADLLDALEADGWLLAVATGKSDRGLKLVLEHHGLFERFVSLQTADRHPSKPDPAMLFAAMREVGAKPADTVMVGDTAFDIDMARAAGVRALGVAWGYHETNELLAAGANVQRPLWASTGVKDPNLPDTLYVTELAVAGVVNTMPEKTMEATFDHAPLHGDAVTGSYAAAQQVLDDLAALGVDYDDVTALLEKEGVDKFIVSWNELLDTVTAALEAAK